MIIRHFKTELRYRKVIDKSAFKINGWCELFIIASAKVQVPFWPIFLEFFYMVRKS